jgi:formate dehydrogenase subunit beta
MEGKVKDHWEMVRQGKVHPDLRPACRSCVEFVPYTADLTLRVVDGPGDFVLIANGERGKALFDGLPGIKWCEDELDNGRIAQLRQVRTENRAQTFIKDANQAGLSGMVSVFGRCIGCHACSKVCPICHCNLCTFESTLFERGPQDHDKGLLARKGVRIPPDTIFFHLGRMVHMATSCVACGSCQDVCPVDIPVSIIFKKVGESLQRTFDYVPGKDLDQPLPVTAFEVEEFMDIEGKER